MFLAVPGSVRVYWILLIYATNSSSVSWRPGGLAEDEGGVGSCYQPVDKKSLLLIHVNSRKDRHSFTVLGSIEGEDHAQYSTSMPWLKEIAHHSDR